MVVSLGVCAWPNRVTIASPMCVPCCQFQKLTLETFFCPFVCAQCPGCAHVCFDALLQSQSVPRLLGRCAPAKPMRALRVNIEQALVPDL